MLTHRMLRGKPVKVEFIWTTKSVICGRAFFADSNKQHETLSTFKEIFPDLTSEKDK